MSFASEDYRFRPLLGLRVTNRSMKMRFPDRVHRVAIMVPVASSTQSRHAFPEDYDGPLPDFATHRDLVTGQDVIRLFYEREGAPSTIAGAIMNRLGLGLPETVFHGTLRRKGGEFAVHPWTWVTVQREGYEAGIDRLPDMVKGKFRMEEPLTYRVDLAFELASDAALAKLLMG